MKTFRAKSGAFLERPYYTDQEIENLCADELATVSLLPTRPEPIRIDRFIEKRFHITHGYEDLPDDVLGLTRFGGSGVAEVVVSRRLEEEGTQVADRRIRSTLAHEAGHGLLHAHLFALAAQPALFAEDTREDNKVLCRGDLEGATVGYKGDWREFQANRTIGGLLLPRRLAELALKPFMIEAGRLGLAVFDRSRAEEAARALAAIFDVNPAVARVRISQLFPMASGAQMAL